MARFRAANIKRLAFQPAHVVLSAAMIGFGANKLSSCIASTKLLRRAAIDFARGGGVAAACSVPACASWRLSGVTYPRLLVMHVDDAMMTSTQRARACNAAAFMIIAFKSAGNDAPRQRRTALLAGAYAVLTACRAAMLPAAYVWRQ
ncbi:hypothetical protein AVEN_48506-1 [Araneus ventricosus]|uniref:Uncharacterized protein n=1 Tax=Araneus ventricosus TaxID=182803 RepID=A0A4Y2RM78_ARAVE|nr:hypothetical protein AVEN_48506-1 [Araneus ventricosus]